jgi:hypothetical protein
MSTTTSAITSTNNERQQFAYFLKTVWVTAATLVAGVVF